jgi:hypothetical protein
MLAVYQEFPDTRVEFPEPGVVGDELAEAGSQKWITNRDDILGVCLAAASGN